MQHKIVILGGGESGAGSAILAKQKGFDVFLSDAGIVSEKYRHKLIEKGVPFEENGHSEDKILLATEVIKSPGIPDKAEIIYKIKQAGIPIISEIEFAGRYTSAKIIAITGSNGKTTTTSLTYHILRKAGLNVGLAGNIGKSFAEQVADSQFDYYVLELSSFQLDNMYRFKADIAVLLNITPDHLDRYDYEMQKYTDSKFRIIQNQTPNDAFIYCADDVVLMKELEHKQIEAQQIPYTVEETKNAVSYRRDGYFIFSSHGRITKIHQECLNLKGKHNIANALAAGSAAHILNIPTEIIAEAFKDFPSIPHRLELIKVHKGIEYINDSKATNVDAAWYALDSFQKPIIWIAGGIDKGNDYSALFELVTEKVKAVICLGKDNQKLFQIFKDKVTCIQEAYSAKEAVEKATALAQKGDVILLSPACASFDLFKNYEDRGNQFKNAILSL